ncbi:L-aspartate oxidase [Petroclostridium xylanilyticum]|uniref:L-aspartate oxidase n=1 Tax=Petroclostridium xylanilyticum TaxID=1792311 RepID=UPI000B98E6AB|nr:L-aspartate oxidase [Petroclostridium xylanilyticum]
MRRFAFYGKIEALEKVYCDVVIIGSGIAGLYTAFNIDGKLSCTVLSKGKIDGCSSYLAQGGIAAVVQDDDKFELHYNDTLYAGAGICNAEAVKVLVSEGPQDIQRLISAGVHFDADDSGRLHATREGGHTKNRILHCGGDSTGREVEKTLFSLVATKSNVTLKENTFLVDIVTHEGKAAGVVVYDEGYKLYISPNVVICSGGIGQVYKYTTNPAGATGDGIAAAIRAGARVENMEFVQFHPTALFHQGTGERYFLISEAVRGEGGILRNQRGERFMPARHPMGDLAPRDIVAREIFREIRKSSIPYVYLDITSKSQQYLSQRFPTIYKECERRGIDMAKQFIPVCPVQHYFMGGIRTDLNGMSSIPGLYACGEAACTGVHGANRLASNSLLECLVFGRRCAEHINGTQRDMPDYPVNFEEKYEYKEINVSDIKEKIKDTMNEKGGIIRNKKELETGLEVIDEILLQLQNIYLPTQEHIEIFNMAIVAQHILAAALKRKECIGAHYRDDVINHEEVKIC